MIPYRIVSDDAVDPCCFCSRPTGCLTALAERASNTQVACCPDCASEREPFQIPGVRAWRDLIRISNLRWLGTR